MGIASKLSKEALEMAKARFGYERVVLRTHKTNGGGLRLYESLGFRRVGEEAIASAYPLKYLAVNFEMDL